MNENVSEKSMINVMRKYEVVISQQFKYEGSSLIHTLLVPVWRKGHSNIMLINL